MKTDPNRACANVEQRLIWALLHDGIAHPLMAITGYSRPAMRFHDWTSHKAWPRTEVPPALVVGRSRHGNPLRAWDLGAGFWCVEHPTISHVINVKAPGLAGAIRQADDWFDSLDLDDRSAS